MAQIYVDEVTHRSIEFVAKRAGVSAGELVAETAAPSVDGLGGAGGVGGKSEDGAVAIYAGPRVQGSFDPRAHRIDITSGPLAGKTFKTPSGTTTAVVRHYRLTVNPNRNGWSFWILDDSSGRLLQTVR